MAETDELRLRAVEPGDEAACAEIFVTARRRARPDLPAERFSLEDYSVATADLDLIVAERGGRVHGFVAFSRLEREVELLFVAPEAQGCGTGALLLAAAARRLGSGAHLLCDLNNVGGRAFYRAQGWVETRVVWGRVEFIRPEAAALPFPAMLGMPIFAL
ncbi:GNAT family N-acetyltransferase [Zavarzinia sp.]|uniref:GNAT family N-acetyltransferase n=1 Tax=Zavarzinia sp. TaxID=2027920 RepID=UPI003569B656